MVGLEVGRDYSDEALEPRFRRAIQECHTQLQALGTDPWSTLERAELERRLEQLEYCLSCVEEGLAMKRKLMYSK